METALFQSVSTVPSGTDSVVWRFPGTLSPANFRGRFATIECPESIYPLQTSKNRFFRMTILRGKPANVAAHTFPDDNVVWQWLRRRLVMDVLL